MNPEAAVETTAVALRRAVNAERPDVLETLLRDYCAAVDSRARQIDPRSAAFAGLEKDALGLLEWARETILAQQAHAGARLRELRTARQYGLSPGPARTTWIQG